MIQKKYYYKVYSNGLIYITTWSKDVISDPEFRTVINGGAGELKVDLARPYDNFGEGFDVSLGNRVELWTADNDRLGQSLIYALWDTAVWDASDYWDNPMLNWEKIYAGYISAYAPTIEDEKQYVEITLLGYVTEASYRINTDTSGNTTVTYTNTDPSTMLKNIIDNYRSNGGINLNYTGTTIQSTGDTATYTFQENTLQECFDRIVEMCPNGWFWFVDATGLVYLQQSRLNQADHQLTIGKDVSYLQTNKRIENLTNSLYIVGGNSGGTSYYWQYSRTGSIAQYGKFERKLQDGQVADSATADLIAARTLDNNQTPETRAVIRITDNNGENINQGANIEGFKIGDTVQIKNLNYGTKGQTRWGIGIWDSDVWDYTIASTTASILTIVSIQYYKTYIEIEASSRLPEVSKRIEQVNSTLNTQFQQDIPTSPTVRTA
jgi:hypothetical protein